MLHPKWPLCPWSVPCHYGMKVALNRQQSLRRPNQYTAFNVCPWFCWVYRVNMSGHLSTCCAAVLLLKIYQEWKYFWRNLKGGNLCVSWLAILSSSRTDSQFLETRRMCRVPTSMWDDSRVPFYAAAYLMTYMDSENIKKKEWRKKWINENICHLGKSSWLSVTGAFSCLLDTLL